MIYDDYIAYTKKYKEEYGPLTVVFIEVGSFWELYNCDQNLGADMKTVGDILNIQVSKKNKSIQEVSAHNPLMAGFPSYCLSKFIPLLINKQYTIILVGQVTPPPNPKRAVTKIISKSTCLDIDHQDQDKDKTNILCSIYIEEHNKSYLIGITMLDLSTGKSNLFEIASIPQDTYYPFDEAYHQIISFKPCEYILNGHVTSIQSDDILDKLHIKNSHHHNFINLRPNSKISIHDHNNTLHKIFPDHGMLTPIEYLMLERNSIALNSYCYGIDFAYKHDELIILKAQKPILQWDNNDLILSHNCIEQLDLYGLENILNRCATSFGKRAFRYRLFNPTFNIQLLNTYYQQIQTTLDTFTLKNLEGFASNLKQTYDIEKLFHRMELLLIKPNELANLVNSLSIIIQILTGNDFAYIFSDDDKKVISSFINTISSQLDLEECAKYNNDTSDICSIFKKGLFKDIDILQENLDQTFKESEHILNVLNSPNSYFKLETSERESMMYISVTKKRYNESKDLITNVVKDHKATLTSNNTNMKITSSYLSDLYRKQLNLQKDIKALITIYFNQVISNINYKYNNIIASSCTLDITITCARNAIEFGYSHPVMNTSNTSYMNACEMRHPIVERLKSLKCDYVPNDISIGLDQSGTLLYGLNAVGKSTLMKATALNIIMAQSGMFVACKSLKYCPYQSIFTRITMRDDIYSGQSTFMVEISELRNILARATKNSLVIGDEICSGTESCSANAIVASMIHFLQEKQASFIFATHLHDLTNIDKINKTNILICHLHVEYDESTNTMLYDRKIRPGQGMRTYGIEVCKALQMPSDFIKLSYEIRNNNTQLLNTTKSRYNPDIPIDNCKLCGNSDVKFLNTHHIREQHTSDENGIIDSHHKNHHTNLVVLCESCHDRVHSGIVTIHGYKQTSDGPKLSYTETITNKDMLEEQIIDLRKKNNSIQSIANQIQKTVYYVNKVLKSHVV